MNHRRISSIIVLLGIGALVLAGCSQSSGGVSAAELEDVRTSILRELGALGAQVAANRARLDEISIALEQRSAEEPGDRPVFRSTDELEGAVASLEARVESLQTLADELEQTLGEMKSRGPGGRDG